MSGESYRSMVARLGRKLADQFIKKKKQNQKTLDLYQVTLVLRN